MKYRKIFEKINEQKGIVLKNKYEEIESLLKPYTKILNSGWEEVNIPNEEIARQYKKLNDEFRVIINEIDLMDKN
jgi:hypothetical protein